MATIKSYTDISQSKKLAGILPLESADYTHLGENEDNVLTRTYFESYSSELKEWIGKDKMYPCWSLASLLDVLPNGIVMNKDSQSGRYHFSFKYIETYVTADNPVDACYKLILMLNELNLL